MLSAETHLANATRARLAPQQPHRHAAAPDRSSAFHVTMWTTVSAVVFLMFFPVLLLRGMFLDGVTYATIARNMAVGSGDMWHPFHTATFLNPYYESPTLALWLQSLFFRVLGDTWWVERLYSVLTALGMAAVIVLVWRQLSRGRADWQQFAWLPVALWIVMPSWYWIYRHNLLENTLGLFAAVSVYASLRAIDSERRWAPWALLAALGIVAAVLSKGPVGLFPAITPAIAWLTMRRANIRKGLFVQFALIGFLAAGFGMLLSWSEAREYMTAYLERQVVASLQGQRDIVDSPLGRFHLAWALSVDLALSALVAGALVFWMRRGKDNRQIHDDHNSHDERERRGALAFCALTALSASLPIMISPKQSAYYAAPSWPYYTLALALWCLPSVSSLASRWTAWPGFGRSASRLRWICGALVLATLATAPLYYGRVFRDSELIDDVARIGHVVAPHTTIEIDPELHDAFSLHAYLYRRHYISLAAGSADGNYYLEPSDRTATAPPGYTLMDAGLSGLRLYARSR